VKGKSTANFGIPDMPCHVTPFLTLLQNVWRSTHVHSQTLNTASAAATSADAHTIIYIRVCVCKHKFKKRHCQDHKISTSLHIALCNTAQSRSQWPSGLKRVSASLLGLRVQIPPGAWMFVCCECCVCCQVEVSATGWSLVQRSSTDCGVSLCVISKPQEWGG
jgi:hypothetical protein